MATGFASGQNTPVPNTAVQQSILHQAQAAAAAQADDADLASSERDEAPLHETDLVTPDTAEDDLPPPAYGGIYGEVHSEKDGLDTSARITHDGRVNIRINQLNRRLSQVFTPALRQYVQNVETSITPPPAYIPPSLGGDGNIPPPPPLNVVIQVVGSRGDVQPFVALGKVLKATYGHRVRLATHPHFANFVKANGLEFFSIGGDPSRLMAFMVQNPGLMPGFRSVLSGDVGQRRKDVSQYIQGCWRSCYESGDGIDADARQGDLPQCSTNDPASKLAARPFVADCIIANPPSFAHIHCAEKLGVPLHVMFTMPYSPTQAFPHPLANIQSSNAGPQMTNYMSYAMIDVLSWQALGDIINRFRRKCLGLDPVSLIWAPGMLQRLKVPHTYCWSPTLIPKPKDWGPQISIPGFFFLDLASEFTPSAVLQAFLSAGPPPVYIGFGSIVLHDPDAMTDLILEAARKSGQRILLSKGWGGMDVAELRKRTPENVFILNNVPHDWLFQRVSCVVHHGGAGTTAAGIAAGRPTVVIPFFGDQPFWGEMVARAGAGPEPIPQRQLTADNLTDAISFCLRPETLDCAENLASKISEERGSEEGAQSFHQHLGVDGLRCTLVPSRAAAWRIKRTNVRLSAFAACTLANAQLLDFHDLKLFRAQEYCTDEGPWDPVTGFAAGIFGAFGNMVSGLVDSPAETWRALHAMAEFSRSQSHVSAPNIQDSVEQAPSDVVTRLQDSREPSQANSDPLESLSHVRSSPAASDRSPSASSMNSKPLHLKDRSLSKGRAGRNRMRRRSSSRQGPNHDMLRPSGPHTSRGLGRVVKAAVQSPMELSMGITKGFHNAPKLWGDDTVRPQEQVSDLKSGFQAIGKEFGYGFYDGVTGLVTQPWRGARRDGTAGFFKGIGKGIGGLATKPGAALFGIPSYFMKGAHKEVQRLFGSNVQNYIITSRTAQGYEEWLQSPDADKQFVIAQWKLVQKYLKKKCDPADMMRDVLEAQQNPDAQDENARPRSSRDRASIPCTVSPSLQTMDAEVATLATGRSRSQLSVTSMPSDESLGSIATIETTQILSQTAPQRDTDMEPAAYGDVTQHQRRLQELADHQAEGDFRQAVVSSEAEARRHASQESRYQRELTQAMEESQTEQRGLSGDAKGKTSGSLDSIEAARRADIPRAEEHPAQTAMRSAAVAGRSSRAPLKAYDSRHLEGATRNELEGEQQTRQNEKSAQEKTEEDIVIEYIKKQSLLESYHYKKGKENAATGENKVDEDL